QIELGQRIAEHLRPTFGELGLTLDSFVVENLSLPEELQKMLDARVGMNMVGDMGRYTQYQVASSLPIAAANEGAGSAGIGVGLGAGLTMAQQVMSSLKPAAETKFCAACGKSIPRSAKFCPECGGAQ
ncbi:MAG: SPFH domain-containing protein, partial [Bryobacteraceae bacterium]